MHGGERIAEVCKGHGVSTLFTLTGGHIAPILVAAQKAGLKVVDVRSEASAVFAADAFARRTGRVGVAVVTAGPGVTNSVTAVENARLSNSPLLVIGGATATLLKGRGALQDIDQMAIMNPVTKWAWRVSRVAELEPVLDQAFSVASHGIPGPVFVEVPMDILYPETVVRTWYDEAVKGRGVEASIRRWWLTRHVSKLFDTGPAGAAPGPDVPKEEVPTLAQVDTSASMLARAKRPLLLLGSSALMAPCQHAKVRTALERLRIPCFLTGMARGALPPEHPLLLRHHRKEAMQEADCILLVGVHADFRLDYGKALNRKAMLIQVTLDPAWLGKNLWLDQGIASLPCIWLEAVSAVHRPSAAQLEWLQTLKTRDEVKMAMLAQQANQEDGSGINPLAVAFSVQGMLDAQDVVVGDGGDFVGMAAHVVSPLQPLSWLDPGPFGTLGVGGGFVLGCASSMRPNGVIWGLFGDGAFGFSLAEVDSWVRHSVPVVAIVGNDGRWSQIAREQSLWSGSDVATSLCRTDYHLAAKGLGADGFAVDKLERLPQVLGKARKTALTGKPVVVNVRLAITERSPDEPPSYEHVRMRP